MRLPAITPTALLVIVPACFSFSPPVRTGNPGAPGNVSKGTVMAGGTGNAAGYSGPMVAYGFTDAVAIESGVETPFSSTIIPYVGVRHTPLDGGDSRYALTFDLEFGGGIGATGVSRVAESRDLDLAGGLYYGLGIGAKVWFWSPFVRGRQQVSWSEEAPPTMLTTGSVGMQFSVLEHLRIWAATGVYSLQTDWGDHAQGWGTWEVGLAVTFGGARQSDAIENFRRRRAAKR